MKLLGKKNKKKNNKLSKKKTEEKKIEEKKKTNKFVAKDFSLIPKVGYTFTPSYIKALDRYGTILKIVNKYGNNRGYSFGWFVSMIPEITVEGVKAYLIVPSKPVTQDTQTDIVRDNITGSLKSYDGETEKNPSANDKRIKQLRVYDLNEADLLDGANNSVITYEIKLLLVGKNPDNINRQIERLESIYKDKLTGIELMSVAGAQEDLFKELLSNPKETMYEYTDMSSNFAGNDHAVRKGLDDKDGWAIGSLAVSYSSGEAFMSLDTSFRRKILISSHKGTSTINGYNEKISSSSMWGQLIANNAMVNGYKTHHIVLNNFKYFGGDTRNDGFTSPTSINSVIQHLDLSKGIINPLEFFKRTYGENDKEAIFNSNKAKNVEIFYLLSKRELSPAQKVRLDKLLSNMYSSLKFWDREHIERVELDRDNVESYPLYSLFINKLTNYAEETRVKGTESEITEANVLKDILTNALDNYGTIFNKYSTIQNHINPNQMQYYYDLSKLREDQNVMEAQFLNVFNYCSSVCKSQDIIMIHGIDRISLETLKVIKGSLENLEEEQGIRLAYIYDVIGTGEEGKDEIEMADTFNTDGILYKNFEREFDYTILGVMTTNEVEKYQIKINQELPEFLKEFLVSGSDNQYQVRRPSDKTSNLINADFII